jgi:2'-hydroxyisoflavone reductase
VAPSGGNEVARILVIGGTLFAGRALVERLLERGDDVTIMHRSQTSPFGDRVQRIRCDRGDIPAVHAALKDKTFDVVFDNVYDWERGTTGEQVRAAAVATARGLSRYVFISSVAVYDHGLDHHEDEPLTSSPDRDPYSLNKADSERALFELHRTEGLPVSTVRPAFIYGPHNLFDRESFFWDRIVADRPVIVPDDGSRLMQWVSADEVARTLIAAADNDVARGRAYNLGSYPPVSQADFVRTLARAAGREPKLAFVPRARIEAAGGQLFAPPLYFGVALDMPPITMLMDHTRNELGIEVEPLEDGLRETFQWYRQQPRPQPDFSWEDRLLASG